MTAAAQTRPARKLPFTRVMLAGLIAIGASIVANLIVRALGLLVLPVDPTFTPVSTWQPTVIFTTVFLLLATVVFLVINAFAANPPRLFTIVATVALVLSLIPDSLFLINPSAMPLGTPTAGAVIILVIQHIVAYAITLWSFTRWAQQ